MSIRSGKVPGDVLNTPFEDYWIGYAPQSLSSFSCIREFNLEDAAFPQHTRDGEVSKRPKVQQGILDRSSSHWYRTATWDRYDSFPPVGMWILDSLSLVTDDPCPFEGGKNGDVIYHRVVGRDHNAGELEVPVDPSTVGTPVNHH